MRRLIVFVCIAAPLAACQPLLPELTPTPTVLPTPIPETSPAPTSISSPTALEPISTATPDTVETATGTVTLEATATTQISATVSIPAVDSATWKAVAGGVNAPIGVTHAGDGSGRLFILEQGGMIRVLKDGVILPEPFLDISAQVDCCGERGLLGLAFHPQYRENGFFFVNYTGLDGNTVIARFQVVPDDPDRADPDSEKRLLYIPQPYRNHNGGAVAFGLDGYLYLGLGDGGSGGDPLGSGQSTDTLLGKILRIDIDGGDPYAIPPDNPFAAGGGLGEIWAYGLRNPWRIAFDRLTGDLYIGDVGQNSWEEIDFLPEGSMPGANFGWNYREGGHPYQGTPPGDVTLIDPVAEYGRDQGCSVTGGVVYRGAELPDWQGVYLYGDYCTGNVWGLLRDLQGGWLGAILFETGSNIVSFGEDEAGEVYLVDYSGKIYRLSSEK